MEHVPDISLDNIYALLAHKPAQSFGEYLLEKLGDRGVSIRQFCQIVGFERKSFDRIVKGEAQSIDALVLLRFAEFLGVEMKDLIAVYLSASPEEQSEVLGAKRAGFITSHFDVKRLREIGFIQSAQDFDEIENRIITFFGISSLRDFDSLSSLPLFSRTRTKGVDKMLTFWLAIVRSRMQAIKNPNIYDESRLEKVIPLFRAATIDVQGGFLSAVRTLWECGVTVIVESYLTGTQIRGGTFLSNGQPYIFLTKHPQYYDTLWFALLHELGHVLFDQDILRKGSGSHISGMDGDLFEDPLLEKGADDFATAILLPKERIEYARSIIHIPGFVRQAAKEWNVHESIVYGMHCYHNPEDFFKYQRLRLHADEAVKFDYTSWKKTTLQETVPELKKQLRLVS